MKNNKDYVWAIFLIFLGSIFLLNTTGVLSWNVWGYILNYWPVFLILGGLRMILGKSLVSTIILSVLAVLAFGWIGVSAYLQNNDTKYPILRNFPTFYYRNEAGDPVSEDFTVRFEDYQEVENIEYDFNLGVSEFTVTDGIEQYLYVDADYTTTYGKPEITESIFERSLTINMREQRVRGFSFLDFRTPKYDIALGTLLPTDLNIDNGIGKGEITLRNQNLRNFNVNTGTGDIKIDLGFDAIPTDSLSIDVGTGSIVLNIPSNVGYVVTYSVGVGEINLGDMEIGGIGQDGDEVKSENFDDAERILNIDANVGVGQLDINFTN
jgi:hypothetical protein